MNKLKKEKTPSFMMNVAIILFAQIMVKILGFIYRIVITNIPDFGDAGNGFYNAGFQVYTVLLAISSVGIPNAVAKMVSERAAVKDYRGAHSVFRSALILFAGIGIIGTGLLYFGADFIALKIMKMDGVQYVMRALAPSILFVCLSSVIRGYFQGLNDMQATSRSQMFEQIFKCTTTIIFVMLAVGSTPAAMSFVSRYFLRYSGDLSKTPAELLAAWANAATAVSTLLSFVYLLFFYKKRQKGIMERIRQSAVESVSESTGKVMKAVLMLSIPISLASIITAVNRVVDLATITRCIEIAFAECIPAHGNTPAVYNPTVAQLDAEAVRLSGMLSKSDTLINMPLALNIAFATVLVPSISRALALGDKKEASEKITYSFLISILLILPCCIGYIVLAKPIYSIIYPNAPLGSDLLAYMAVSLIFSALSQTMSGALQGLGKALVPAVSILCGCIIKVILNILLISRPEINIYGAAISSIACQFTAFLISFIVLSKYISLKMSAKKYIIKPLLSCTIMGASAYIVYKISMSVLHSNLISTFIAIAIAVIIYAILIFSLKILSEDEVKMLPCGTALYKILVRAKIYK